MVPQGPVMALSDTLDPYRVLHLEYTANCIPRSAPHLFHHPRHTYHSHPAMRDYTLMGPAAISPSFPVPSQADPAADQLRPLLARNPILFNRQLPTIPQGRR